MSNFKHGLYKSIHYSRWSGMIRRCESPKDTAYKDYGGRGISVCERWHDIKNFIADLPEGYYQGAEIDRINNDGNYEPGNVKWSSASENCDNRRSGRIIEYNGKSQSLTAWSKEIGISIGTLWERLEIWKWSIEKTLTDNPMDAKQRMLKAHETRWAGHVRKAKPTPKVLRTVEVNGEQLTIKELSAKTGISKELLRKRIFERGWPIEKAMI